MKLIRLCFIYASIGLFFAFISCKNDDNNTPAATGTLSLSITDGPIDDAQVQGAYVTISEIMIDGKKVDGFNKTTIDLLSYQKGVTKLLANTELEAKHYSSVMLMLDFDTDADGNIPGSYVKLEGNVKEKLSSSANEFMIQHDFDILSNSESQMILDFDLRKCITKQSNTTNDYEFVSVTEMENSIRLLHKDEAGTIEGNCKDLISNSDKIVVYAYKKGEFDLNTEMNGQGQSKIEFAKAVTSTSLESNGDFELHFLETGDYEVHFCSYKKAADGSMELQGTLIVDVLNAVDLGAIKVNANSTVTANVLVSGLLPN